MPTRKAHSAASSVVAPEHVPEQVPKVAPRTPNVGRRSTRSAMTSLDASMNSDPLSSPVTPATVPRLSKSRGGVTSTQTVDRSEPDTAAKPRRTLEFQSQTPPFRRFEQHQAKRNRPSPIYCVFCHDQKRHPGPKAQHETAGGGVSVPTSHRNMTSANISDYNKFLRLQRIDIKLTSKSVVCNRCWDADHMHFPVGKVLSPLQKPRFLSSQLGAWREHHSSDVVINIDSDTPPQCDPMVTQPECCACTLLGKQNGPNLEYLRAQPYADNPDPPELIQTYFQATMPKPIDSSDLSRRDPNVLFTSSSRLCAACAGTYRRAVQRRTCAINRKCGSKMDSVLHVVGRADAALLTHVYRRRDTPLKPTDWVCNDCYSDYKARLDPVEECFAGIIDNATRDLQRFGARLRVTYERLFDEKLRRALPLEDPSMTKKNKDARHDRLRTAFDRLLPASIQQWPPKGECVATELSQYQCGDLALVMFYDSALVGSNPVVINLFYQSLLAQREEEETTTKLKSDFLGEFNAVIREQLTAFRELQRKYFSPDMMAKGKYDNKGIENTLELIYRTITPNMKRLICRLAGKSIGVKERRNTMAGDDNDSDSGEEFVVTNSDDEEEQMVATFTPDAPRPAVIGENGRKKRPRRKANPLHNQVRREATLIAQACHLCRLVDDKFTLLSTLLGNIAQLNGLNSVGIEMLNPFGWITSYTVLLKSKKAIAEKRDVYSELRPGVFTTTAGDNVNWIKESAYQIHEVENGHHVNKEFAAINTQICQHFGLEPDGGRLPIVLKDHPRQENIFFSDEYTDAARHWFDTAVYTATCSRIDSFANPQVLPALPWVKLVRTGFPAETRIDRTKGRLYQGPVTIGKPSSVLDVGESLSAIAEELHLCDDNCKLETGEKRILVYAGDQETVASIWKLQAEYPGDYDWVLAWIGDWHVLRLAGEIILVAIWDAGGHTAAIECGISKDCADKLTFDETKSLILRHHETLSSHLLTAFCKLHPAPTAHVRRSGRHGRGSDAINVPMDIDDRDEQTRYKEWLCRLASNTARKITTEATEDEWLITYSQWFTMIDAWVALQCAKGCASYDLRNCGLQELVDVMHGFGHEKYIKLLARHIKERLTMQPRLEAFMRAGGFVYSYGGVDNNIALDEVLEAEGNEPMKRNPRANETTVIANAPANDILNDQHDGARRWLSRGRLESPGEKRPWMMEDWQASVRVFELYRVLSQDDLPCIGDCVGSSRILKANLGIKPMYSGLTKPLWSEKLCIESRDDSVNLLLYCRQKKAAFYRVNVCDPPLEAASQTHLSSAKLRTATPKRCKDSKQIEGHVAKAALAQQRAEVIARDGGIAVQVHYLPLSYVDIFGELRDPVKSQWLAALRQHVLNGDKEHAVFLPECPYFHHNPNSRGVTEVLIDAMFLIHCPPSPACKTISGYLESLWRWKVAPWFTKGASVVAWVQDDPNHLSAVCWYKKLMRAARAEAAANSKLVERIKNIGIPTMEFPMKKIGKAGWAVALQSEEFVRVLTMLITDYFTQRAREQLHPTKTLIIDTAVLQCPREIKGQGRPRDCKVRKNTHGEADSKIWYHIATSVSRRFLLVGNDSDHTATGAAVIDSNPRLFDNKHVIVSRGALTSTKRCPTPFVDLTTLVTTLNRHPILSKTVGTMPPAMGLLLLYLVTGSDYVSKIVQVTKASGLQTYLRCFHWINGLLAPENGQIGEAKPLVTHVGDGGLPKVSHDAMTRLEVAFYHQLIAKLVWGGRAIETICRYMSCLPSDRPGWGKAAINRIPWTDNMGANGDGAVSTLTDVAEVTRLLSRHVFSGTEEKYMACADSSNLHNLQAEYAFLCNMQSTDPQSETQPLCFDYGYEEYKVGKARATQDGDTDGGQQQRRYAKPQFVRNAAAMLAKMKRKRCRCSGLCSAKAKSCECRVACVPCTDMCFCDQTKCKNHDHDEAGNVDCNYHADSGAGDGANRGIEGVPSQPNVSDVPVRRSLRSNANSSAADADMIDVAPVPIANRAGCAALTAPTSTQEVQQHWKPVVVPADGACALHAVVAGLKLAKLPSPSAQQLREQLADATDQFLHGKELSNNDTREAFILDLLDDSELRIRMARLLTDTDHAHLKIKPDNWTNPRYRQRREAFTRAYVLYLRDQGGYVSTVDLPRVSAIVGCPISVVCTKFKAHARARASFVLWDCGAEPGVDLGGVTAAATIEQRPTVYLLHNGIDHFDLLVRRA